MKHDLLLDKISPRTLPYFLIDVVFLSSKSSIERRPFCLNIERGLVLVGDVCPFLLMKFPSTFLYKIATLWQALVLHFFIPSTLEAEVGGSL